MYTYTLLQWLALSPSSSDSTIHAEYRRSRRISPQHFHPFSHRSNTDSDERVAPRDRDIPRSGIHNIVSVLHRFADKLIKREPHRRERRSKRRATVNMGNEHGECRWWSWSPKAQPIGTGPRTSDLFAVDTGIAIAVDKKTATTSTRSFFGKV